MKICPPPCLGKNIECLQSLRAKLFLFKKIKIWEELMCLGWERKDSAHIQEWHWKVLRLGCVKDSNYSCLPSFSDYNIHSTGGFAHMKYEKSLQNRKDIMTVSHKTALYSGGKQWEEPRSSLSPSKSGSFHLQIPACSTVNRGKSSSCLLHGHTCWKREISRRGIKIEYFSHINRFEVFRLI